MLRLLIAQRLIGLLMTLAVGAAAWFIFGKDIYNDVRDEVDRESGGGPRSENGNYDDLKRNEDATVSVASTNAYPLRRIDPGGPQRIVEKIEKREGGGDFLVTQLRLIRDGGPLIWVVHGRIGQRGIGYYADPRGRHLETATKHLSP